MLPAIDCKQKVPRHRRERRQLRSSLREAPEENRHVQDMASVFVCIQIPKCSEAQKLD